MAINLNQHINSIPDPTTRQAVRGIVQDLLADMAARVAVFNAHTHKTPTTATQATSTPTSDAGGSGSTGGTASAQSVSRTV